MWLLKCFPVQATAYFRWVNAVVEASEKPLVMINMDEASVPLHLTGSVGTFFVETSNFPQKPGDRAQLGDRRNNITYIASVCSDASCCPKFCLAMCVALPESGWSKLCQKLAATFSYGENKAHGTTGSLCRSTYACWLTVWAITSRRAMLSWWWTWPHATSTQQCLQEPAAKGYECF